MISSKRLFFAVLILPFLAFAAGAQPALTPHEAVYKVKISVLSGELTTRLASTGSFYTANHVIEPKGLARIAASGRIDESSTFQLQDGNVRTRRYRSSDELTSDKTRADVDFRWDASLIEGTVNGDATSVPFDGVLHDRLSIQYQLMQDLQSGSVRDEYRLFDIDEIKVLTVSRIGTRTVKTPAGTFEAIGIQHRAGDSTRTTTLWCVAELDYLPVIIEQHRKGKLRLRATLTDYRPTA